MEEVGGRSVYGGGGGSGGGRGEGEEEDRASVSMRAWMAREWGVVAADGVTLPVGGVWDTSRPSDVEAWRCVYL
jgi:hypothetical protein